MKSVNPIELNSKDYTNINRILILFANVVLGVLSLLLIVGQYPNIWFDEVASLYVFTNSWKNMWTSIITDTHPPLYFVIMKLIISIAGNHYKVIKASQLMPIILLHAWISLLVIRNRKVISKPATGILTILYILCTFAPRNFMEMNVFIRMYSWAMFFVTINGVYSFRILSYYKKADVTLKYSSDEIIFVLTGIAGALTHYYALFCEIIIYVFLFVFILFIEKTMKQKILEIMKLFITTALGYIWWIPFAVHQIQFSSSNIDWMTFSFSDITNIISWFTDYYDLRIVAIFWAFVIVSASLSFFKEKVDEKSTSSQIYIFGLFFFILPFIILTVGVVLSVLVKPFLWNRYLFIPLGLFWLGIVMLISVISENKNIYIGLLFGLMLAMLFQNYPDELEQEYETGTRDIVEWLRSSSSNEDLIISNIEHLAYGGKGTFARGVLGYYYPDNPIMNVNEFNDIADDYGDIVWYFKGKESDTDELAFNPNKYTIERQYVGNIDNRYDVEVYKLCPISR